MITGGADVTVLDREGKPVLVVEAKSRFDVTQRWAGRTFRNKYAHGSVPDVLYFLLLVPDTFYLWRDPGLKAEEAFVRGSRTEVPPDYAVPAWETVRQYLGEDVSPHDVSSYSMSMVANAFVADLINSDLTRKKAPQYLWWVFESGLYDAIHGGSLAGNAGQSRA